MELVTIEKKQLDSLFIPKGCDGLIDRIREEVAKHNPDLTTAAGRKDIASLAYKVRQSKTVIDKAGMEFVADIKAKVRVVDIERKRVRDELDEIAKDIRKPLDEWEAEEKLKAEQELERIAMENAHEDAIAENQLFDREQVIAKKEAEAQRLYEEAEAKAKAAQERADKLQRDAEAKEAAEVARWEREEREKLEAKEREERKEREAAEKAEREEREREEREEREAAIKEKAAKDAERELLEKQEAERKKAERRAKRKAHVAKVDKDIMDCLAMEGFTQDIAEQFLLSIKTGAINHVTINY